MKLVLSKNTVNYLAMWLMGAILLWFWLARTCLDEERSTNGDDTGLS